MLNIEPQILDLGIVPIDTEVTGEFFVQSIGDASVTVSSFNLSGTSFSITETEPWPVALLSKYDMIYIVAGMGGGTGSGASPVIANIAKEANIRSIAVVTRPFFFEGRRRRRTAEEGIEELQR